MAENLGETQRQRSHGNEPSEAGLTGLNWAVPPELQGGSEPGDRILFPRPMTYIVNILTNRDIRPIIIVSYSQHIAEEL